MQTLEEEEKNLNFQNKSTTIAKFRTREVGEMMQM